VGYLADVYTIVNVNTIHCTGMRAGADAMRTNQRLVRSTYGTARFGLPASNSTKVFRRAIACFGFPASNAPIAARRNTMMESSAACGIAAGCADTASSGSRICSATSSRISNVFR